MGCLLLSLPLDLDLTLVDNDHAVPSRGNGVTISLSNLLEHEVYEPSWCARDNRPLDSEDITADNLGSHSGAIVVQGDIL